MYYLSVGEAYVQHLSLGIQFDLNYGNGIKVLVNFNKHYLNNKNYDNKLIKSLFTFKDQGFNHIKTFFNKNRNNLMDFILKLS